MRIRYVLLLILVTMLMNSCKHSTNLSASIPTNTNTNTTTITTPNDAYLHTNFLDAEYLNNLSETIYGEESSEFIVYIYSPYCSHCQSVMSSETYQRFITYPPLRLYKINVLDLTDNNKDFLKTFNITGVPLMLRVKRINQGVYEVDQYSGSINRLNLLNSYLNNENH